GFGPWCGFLFGWAQLCVLLPARIGAMAIVFADFANPRYELPAFTAQGLSSEFTYAVPATLLLAVLTISAATPGTFAHTVVTLAATEHPVGAAARRWQDCSRIPAHQRRILGRPGIRWSDCP